MIPEYLVWIRVIVFLVPFAIAMGFYLWSVL